MNSALLFSMFKLLSKNKVFTWMNWCNKKILLISALLINSIHAIDSRFLQTTAIKNDHKSTEQFTNRFDNENGAYGSSKINQLRKHANIHGAKNLTVNDKRFKHLPYLKNDNLKAKFLLMRWLIFYHLHSRHKIIQRTLCKTGSIAFWNSSGNVI